MPQEYLGCATSCALWRRCLKSSGRGRSWCRRAAPAPGKGHEAHSDRLPVDSDDAPARAFRKPPWKPSLQRRTSASGENCLCLAKAHAPQFNRDYGPLARVVEVAPTYQLGSKQRDLN